MIINRMKIALCQIAVTDIKATNLKTARDAIKKAVTNEENVSLVSLPECWNSPYNTSAFPAYAEEIPATSCIVNEEKHPSTALITQSAKEFGIYVVGGSIPEKDVESGNVPVSLQTLRVK